MAREEEIGEPSGSAQAQVDPSFANLGTALRDDGNACHAQAQYHASLLEDDEDPATTMTTEEGLREELRLSAEIGQALLVKWEAAQQDCDALRANWELEQTRNVQLSRELADWKAEHGAWIDERAKWSKKLADMQSSLAALESEYAETRQDLDAKNERLRKMHDRERIVLPKLQERATAELAAQIVELEQQLECKALEEEAALKRADLLAKQCETLREEVKAGNVRDRLFADAQQRLAGQERLQQSLEQCQAECLQLRRERDDWQAQKQEANTLENLVKELSAGNERLTQELRESKQLLTSARQEIQELRSSLEEAEYSVDITRVQTPSTPMPIGKSIFAELESYVQNSVASSFRKKNPMQSRLGLSTKQLPRDDLILDSMHDFDPYAESPLRKGKVVSGGVDEVADNDLLCPGGVNEVNDENPILRSDPLDVVDVFSEDSPQKPDDDQKSLSFLRHPQRSHVNSSLLSVRKDVGSQTAALDIGEGQELSVEALSHIPEHLRLLVRLANEYLDRLEQSNMLALNRRLRRAFDMRELTRLSNAVIENILHDLGTLRKRFPDPEKSKDGKWLVPLVELLHSLLSELARLRKTVNDVGAAYVEKMEDLGKKDALRSLAMRRSGGALLGRQTGIHSEPHLPRAGSSDRSIASGSSDGFLKRAASTLWGRNSARKRDPNTVEAPLFSMLTLQEEGEQDTKRRLSKDECIIC